MVEHHLEEQARITLTERLRGLFKQPLERIGFFVYSLGVKPNWITLFGLIGTMIGAYYISQGNLVAGGIIIFIMGPFDALDGAVARAGNEVTKFGAFIDSVSDRYIEIMIYGGILWYFLSEQNSIGVLLTFLASAGSVLVSYNRARAQSLGMETKVGILTRFERMLVIGPSLIFSQPLIGVALVAILANITALQRIYHVKHQADAQ
ncbi:MAG: CDP-alcohol phosphatidyltransferase family protein [Aliifodinibius sp.]|nr:CDP-alcohol phosphatidyltransferase family protein [Fodinibius sp.]